MKMVKHTHGAPLNASSPAVADLDLSPLHDYGNLPDPLAVNEHFVKLCPVALNVVVFSPVTVDRPGLVGVGSSTLSVYLDLIAHVLASKMYEYLFTDFNIPQI